MRTESDDARTSCAIGLWKTSTQRPEGLLQWVDSIQDQSQVELANSLLLDAMEKGWAVVVVSEVAASQGAAFSIRGAGNWEGIVEAVTRSHIDNCHHLGERTLLPVKVLIVDWCQESAELAQALAAAGMIDLNQTQPAA